ncbi:hypothetical protein HYR69_00560 [Candidatus Sumerlaeota bacterium]|nr:hypothetical protein [Candidatus Sumerlaeota bacterium]
MNRLRFCPANPALRYGAALGCFFIFVSCRSAKHEAPYPHESVLSILAELKIALRADPYKSEPGRDLDGRNIYRVTIERLDNLQELLSKGQAGDYGDIIAFARGESQERLGQWNEAASSFRSAAGANTSIAEQSRNRQHWAERIALTDALTTGGLTLEGHLNTLDLRRSSYRRMTEESPPYPYAGYLRAEMEQALREKALFLFSNRYVLPRGAEQAIEAAQTLIEENAQSYRKGENLLLLGQIQETLARDYCLLNDPAGGKFDADLCSRWIEGARQAYRKAAQSDGDPAKPEAQARLRSLDAFALRITARAR